MLTYEQALAQILAGVTPLPPVPVPLAEALGLILAEDIVSPLNLPPFANSSMDGYAVRATDVQAGRALPVMGEVPAGALSVPALMPGTVVRIMTGAPIPAGADAVVPVEETEAHGDGVTFGESAAVAQCIRLAGEDVTVGSVVLTAGHRIRPAEIGLCAALGRTTVLAHPRPRVAIVSTGDELVEPGQALQLGQIYNSNAYSLAAQVTEAGGIVVQRRHARDTPEALREAFDACAGADMLLTSGGVSVGDFDYVKDVFAERGTVDFWRVAIRPGKPLAFGRWGETVFIGLPGNPVSSQVTFELFARPALRRMAGRADLGRTQVQARLTETASHNPGRQSYLRAVATRQEGGYVVRPVSLQGSGMLRSMTLSNALLVLPTDVTEVAAGQDGTVILLD